MGERVVGWSHLPIEILLLIANSIPNRIDLLRFRGVCKSWRSSVPPPHSNSPSFPIKVPSFTASCRRRGNALILTQTTFYRITPPTNTNNDDSYPKGWLVQVEEHSNCLPLRLFHPLSNRRIMNPPKLWDLSHCGIIELCNCYTIKLRKDGDALYGITKVMFFQNPCGNVENFVVFCIFKEGRLVFMRKGDKSWTLVGDRSFHYDDVIVYKGQFYVVDRWGIVSWIDVLSSSRLIQYSPPVVGSRGKKVLVESCGCLYVVERYCNEGEVVDFKVYKLDEEWGSWVDVKKMDDRVFVLGDKCSFSVSAKEFAGYQGNCIYFFDFYHVRMYNLSDGSIVKVGGYPSFSNLFWPPPSWLRVR